MVTLMINDQLFSAAKSHLCPTAAEFILFKDHLFSYSVLFSKALGVWLEKCEFRSIHVEL